MKAIKMLSRMRFKNITGAKVNALPNCALFLSKVKVALLTHPLCHKNAEPAKILTCQDIKNSFFWYDLI